MNISKKKKSKKKDWNNELQQQQMFLQSERIWKNDQT